MATRVINDSKLQSIAVAIQAKDNGGQMTVDEMPTRIDALPTAPTLIPKTITQNGVYNATDDNADGYDVVTVDVNDFDVSVSDNQVKMLVYIDDNVADCYVNYVQTVANDVEVDWGDGSPIETSPSIGGARNTCATIFHSYSKRGFIIISLSANEGTVKLLASNGFLSFGGASGKTNGNQFPNNNYRYNVLGLSFGDNTRMLVDGSVNLASIIFAYNINFTLQYTSASYITIRNGTQTFPDIRNTRIRSILIPNTVTTFRTGVMNGCPLLGIIDFTTWDLENLNNSVFNGSFLYESGTSANSLGHPILLFATQEIAEAAKQKTNLAVYADWIKYEGEEY